MIDKYWIQLPLKYFSYCWSLDFAGPDSNRKENLADKRKTSQMVQTFTWRMIILLLFEEI